MGVAPAAPAKATSSSEAENPFFGKIRTLCLMRDCRGEGLPPCSRPERESHRRRFGCDGSPPHVKISTVTRE